MTLSMMYCVGRAGCARKPDAGRGLCTTCYSHHRQRGTLDMYPTMRERTAQLRAAGQTKVLDDQRRHARNVNSARLTAAWRAQQYALRVELGGHLIHPKPVHGRMNTYTALGCRGPMCYAAWCHYRTTRVCRLPEAVAADFTAEDCALYSSDVYPDHR